MGIAVPLLLLFTVINCDTRTGGIFMKKRKLPHVHHGLLPHFLFRGVG